MYSFLFLILANLSLLAPDSFAQNNAYKLRGSGDSLRKEGLGKENVGAHFSLVSVLRGVSSWEHAKLPLLAVKFFMPEEATAYLHIREKVNVQTYKLDAVNIHWPSGWNTFGPWSANEVIHNSDIPVDNLGVTITQRITPHSSGIVYPAVLIDGNSTGNVSTFLTANQYSFVVKSNTGLEPFKWGLYKLTQDGRQLKLNKQEFYVDKLVAGVPFEINIDASKLKEGYYKLKMRGEYITSDYSKVVKKNFKFYHNVN